MKLQHDPSNRDHLRNSRDFTGPPRSHVHFADEQMQYARADENDGIARDNEDREPGWESAVLRIDIAPITDAQCDDAAQKQSFVGPRSMLWP